MIRPAKPEDVAEIHAMVRELAEYEKAPDEAKATPEQLHDALFGAHPAVFAHIAEDESGHVVGMAVWFLNYSTWTGKHGIYLEDLYVRPSARGTGYGKALLAQLARICVERDFTRLEWSVLDWNTPAIAVYRSQGAVPMDEWTVHRLTGDALRAMAER